MWALIRNRVVRHAFNNDSSRLRSPVRAAALSEVCIERSRLPISYIDVHFSSGGLCHGVFPSGFALFE